MTTPESEREEKKVKNEKLVRRFADLVRASGGEVVIADSVGSPLDRHRILSVREEPFGMGDDEVLWFEMDDGRLAGLVFERKGG